MPQPVYKKPCKNCLFSKDRIVSEDLAKEIIESCKSDKSFFICHKSSFNQGNTMCNRYFHEVLNNEENKMVTDILVKAGHYHFVEIEDNSKLPVYQK